MSVLTQTQINDSFQGTGQMTRTVLRAQKSLKHDNENILGVKNKCNKKN